MGQVLSDIFQSTSSGASLQTPLCSSPSSDSCSDLSASGSSVHLSSLDSHGDSITSSALHQNSHGDLHQEILCNSSTYVPTLDPPLGVDSNIEVVEKKRRLAIPRLSHINSIKPSGKERERAEEKVSKGVEVIKERGIKPLSSDSCSDLSTNGSSVYLSSSDLHGDSNASSALHQLIERVCQEMELLNHQAQTHAHMDSSTTSALHRKSLIFQQGWDSHTLQRRRDRDEEKVSKGVVAKERWIKHYSSHQNILLVGEGDFSFSACLALAFGSANNMIATSLNSKGFLKKNYGKAKSNIKKLRSRGCKVMHGVDATKMANHLALEGMEFDRIIFNFPFAGVLDNESRKSALGRHRELVRQFLANAKKMIAEKGEIHISHKSNGFFLACNVELLATQAGLRLIEAVDFNLNDYPGYNTKYGFGGDKNFNCNPSRTYKFGLKKQPKMRSKRL